eukprot:467652_1
MSRDAYPTDQYPDTIETVNASAAGIFAIVSLVITATHSVKVYQDLFTTERKSLDHRRSKPVIDVSYKKATYLTLTTAILYTILLLCNAIQYNLSKDCMLALIFIGWIAYFYSKAGLYLIYVLRLHQVYGLSAYGYKPTTLVSIAGFIFVFCTAMYIYAQVLMVTASYNTIYDDTDNVFPYYCTLVVTQQPHQMIVGGLITLFDFVFGIGAIVFFIIPLNKVIYAASGGNRLPSEDPAVEKRRTKMLYSGYKYKILVICASATTLAAVACYAAGLESVALILLQLDNVINPICLLMMTSYYPSNIFYERLCCLCILCCDPKRKSYRSHARDKAEIETRRASAYTKSLDTSQEVGGALRPNVESTNTIPVDNAAPTSVDLTPAPASPKDNSDHEKESSSSHSK